MDTLQLELLVDPRRIDRIANADVPALLVHLASIQTALAARLLERPADAGAPREGLGLAQAEPDALLSVAEAASLLSVKPRWLYRNAKRLPFTRRLSRKALRFSKSGLLRWIAARKL
jgi:hypothetical protein